MIKIDWKGFIYDRIWFGYCRGAVRVPYGEDNNGGKWKWKWIKL